MFTATRTRSDVRTAGRSAATAMTFPTRSRKTALHATARPIFLLNHHNVPAPIPQENRRHLPPEPSGTNSPDGVHHRLAQDHAGGLRDCRQAVIVLNTRRLQPFCANDLVHRFFYLAAFVLPFVTSHRSSPHIQNRPSPGGHGVVPSWSTVPGLSTGTSRLCGFPAPACALVCAVRASPAT
jgi:hypothetical protein